MKLLNSANYKGKVQMLIVVKACVIYYNYKKSVNDILSV